ncbi:MAG: hypothetical protein ABIF08_04420 [Nanoarchaeota archaeon]
MEWTLRTVVVVILLLVFLAVMLLLVVDLGSGSKSMINQIGDFFQNIIRGGDHFESAPTDIPPSTDDTGTFDDLLNPEG